MLYWATVPPKYKTQLVTWPNHWCLGSEELGGIRVPPHGLRRFLIGLQLPPAQYAILTTVNGELVGCLRHNITRRCLMVEAAWVTPTHRRNGMATLMWERARDAHQTRRAEAMAVTRAGQLFLRAMANHLGPAAFGLVEGI